MMKHAFPAVLMTLALAGCATPYQEMGLLGGVSATQISGNTLQVTARGNGFTDPDAIQRYALRKSAEGTIAAGFDVFSVGNSTDRTRRGQYTTGYATGDWRSAFGTSSSYEILKPGQTLLVRMSKYPAPDPMPEGMFDAREVLKFATTGSYVPPAPTK